MGSPAEITVLLLHFQSDHYRNASFWCDTARYRLISKAVLSIQQHFKTGPGWSGSQTPLLLLVTEGGRKSHLGNVKILWGGWFDEKWCFHTNGTLEKHQSNFL